MTSPGVDIDGKPDSGIPLGKQREWVIPKWLKEVGVAVAVLCLGTFAASKLIEKYRGGRIGRVAASLEAELLDGRSAPELNLPARGGGAVQLAQRRGKVVLVNFWATWCPPCRAEEPGLDRLSRLFDPSSFEIIAVSTDEGWGPVENYFGARVPGYRVALDGDGAVQDRWGTNKFPETYVVDASGALRFKMVGPRDWTSPEALALLEQLGARRR